MSGHSFGRDMKCYAGVMVFAFSLECGIQSWLSILISSSSSDYSEALCLVGPFVSQVHIVTCTLVVQSSRSVLHELLNTGL